MDDAKKAEARKFAARAAEQAKHAAQNTAKAAESGAESVTNPVTDRIEDAAETVYHDVSSSSELTKGIGIAIAGGLVAYGVYRKLRGK